MKVAIIVDWLVIYAGAERVLEQMIACYPDADIFAVVDFMPQGERDFIHNKKVKTTFIQKLPFAKTKYRSYLPLMPLAIEQLDLAGYDLILSSSHAVAKGVITGPGQTHISYVHSPMRYAWDLQQQYLQESNSTKGPKSWLMRYLLHKLRLWDFASAARVDHFISSSNYIAQRINKAYRRKATVIHPPVAVEKCQLLEEKEEFYVTAARLVPFKRVPLIAEAFSKMPNKKLVILGDGPELEKTKAFNTHGNIEFLGFQNHDVVVDYLQRAKAFLYAANDDFGILPVEAQACGTPVIAFNQGGVLETIRGLDAEKPTGVFYESQTANGLIEAIDAFEQTSISPKDCRENSLRFSEDVFKNTLKKFVSNKREKTT